MSMLDNLAQAGQNQWLSEKLEDNPAEDQALQTTARIATAHIWPFLASSISDDDYRNRRGVKEDQVRYICATIGPHVASALTNYVLAGFDADYAVLRKKAQEELAADALLPELLGGMGGGGEDEDPDNPPLLGGPKASHLVREAPGGGVHGPYYTVKKGDDWVVENSQGEVKGTHDTKGEARQQQEAMYANIPEAREQAEEHEGKPRPKAVGSRRSGAIEGPSTLIPNANQDEDDDDDEEAHGPAPVQQQQHHRRHGPSLLEGPKADQELEDPNEWYGQWGAGGQTMKASAVDRFGHLILAHAEDTEFDPQDDLYGHMKYDHGYIYMQNGPQWPRHYVEEMHAEDHANPSVVDPMDHPHTHEAARRSLTVGEFGHIGGRQSWRRDPENDDYDWDRDYEESEAEHRSPEHDVVHHPEDDREYEEADWESAPRGEGDWRGGVRRRDPHTSAEKEKGEVPCPICHKKFEPGELAEHMEKVHGVSGSSEEGKEHGKKPPGAARAGQSKPKPSAGRQTHRPTRGRPKGPAKQSAKKTPRPPAYGDMTDYAKLRHLIDEHPNPQGWSMVRQDERDEAHKLLHLKDDAGHTHQWPVGSRPPKEAQLVRSTERLPEGRRSAARAEEGYDPSEAFPGYYGTPEPPQRRRMAQAPLAGNSDVPQDPESSTGASGTFNPGGALNVAMPGGTVNTDFAQQDAPQDIQAQLGQLPTLSHKIGAKLAEIATEVMANNPSMSAVAAMDVAMQVVRLYPKVAAGGADYLREPGTEGEPPERLEDCPQCQREAYNPEINRCHFCGFYDAGLEPSIEVT